MTRKKPPKQKAREEYKPQERREEILKLILQAGHPKNVSQTELSKIYGVSQPMINKDMKMIAKDVVKELPKEAQFITQVVFNSAIKSLAKGDNADKFKAAKLVKDWNDWLFDLGKQKRAPKEMKLEGDLNTRGIVVKIIHPDDDRNNMETDKKANGSIRDSKRQKDN